MTLSLPRLCIIAMFCTAAAAYEFQPTTKDKKLIAYGWDWPNPAYIRQNIRAMEKRPYDGIVIGVTESREPGVNQGSLGGQMFTQQRFDAAKYEHAIDDLNAARFERFTDNFIQMQATPSDIDWFDDEHFEGVLHNAKILARIAKQSGCVGLMFDPEEYNDRHIWTYAAWPDERRGGRGEEQFIEKVRQRGGQFMRGINSEFPRVKILCLLGPSFTWNHLRNGSHKYRLLGTFIDGMCEAADEGTRIIDGYEQSYPYRIPAAFAAGRKEMLDSREMFRSKEAFDRVMRVGFGLWQDHNSGKRGWHPDQHERNHFEPATWQTAMHSALSHSDEYVWMWHERFNHWTGENHSLAYEQATREARQSPGRIAAEKNPARQPYAAKAADQKDHDDDATFGDLLETSQTLFDLPKTGWLFKPDPTDEGVRRKWFSPDASTDGWSQIEIGQFWEEQGWDFDGAGWYRCTFTIQNLPKHGPVLLCFGAADEAAIVWLNDRQVGTHDQGEAGWDDRFCFDVTDHLKVGQNTMVARVFDRTGPGGLWKSVRILRQK